MTRAERIAEAARDTIGACFRAQGRDPATGLDCVGVAAWAAAAAGCRAQPPSGYALRSGTIPRDADAGDLMRADGSQAGDILLLRVAPTQLHMAVRTATGIVHADVALRRVVERPGAPPWPLVAAWRARED